MQAGAFIFVLRRPYGHIAKVFCDSNGVAQDHACRKRRVQIFNSLYKPEYAQARIVASASPAT